MPCEPLDALKNLTKEVPRQVAFGKLQGEVPGMPDEAVLNSRCWRLVRDQLWMATGKTSRVGADDSATGLTVGKAVVPLTRMPKQCCSDRLGHRADRRATVRSLPSRSN